MATKAEPLPPQSGPPPTTNRLMNSTEATALVNELFETLGPVMMRFAMRSTRSAQTAEDLVQEVFLALYRDLRNGKAIHNPQAWAIGALRNQTRKYARTCRLHPEAVLDPELFDALLSPVCPVFDTEPELYLDSRALRLLSPREEEVILLRLQALKYREIGEQLGISSKSVCTLLARALRKLRHFTKQDQSSGGSRQTEIEDREVPSALR